jgi:hypothetical protein
MRPLLALSASAVLLSACSRSPAPAPQAQPAAPAAGATAAAPAPTPKGPTAYVTAVAVVKVEASDASRIAAKGGGKELANFVALLYRGEQVGVLETHGDWARIRSSGDKEGWMKRSSILEGEGLKEATVLTPTDVFDRPDLLAANAKKKLDPGTFVLVVKDRPPFSEVNHSGSQNVWVLTERLATGEKDVAAAKLVEKARYLARNNKRDEALATLNIIRQVAPESPLVAVLAAELGEAPAGDAATPSPPPASGPQGTDPLSPGSAANQ